MVIKIVVLRDSFLRWYQLRRKVSSGSDRRRSKTPALVVELLAMITDLVSSNTKTAQLSSYFGYIVKVWRAVGLSYSLYSLGTK
jgi:hypothetical protein